jgi:hypothetical protein
LEQNNFVELLKIWSKDVFAFAEDVLESFLVKETPDFHKEIYKFLLESNRLALAAPRGFAKSVICSVIYPIHQALTAQHRDILIISASETLAIDWLRKIKREFEQNTYINAKWGDVRSTKWTENHIIVDNKLLGVKINIRARGAGGQIRGFRPDLVILDDIETDESVASEDQRNKLRDWVFKACINALTPDGQLIWIGTIISPLALLQEMLSCDNNWVKRKYRAYIDGDQKEGKELWGQYWTHTMLQARKKEIGSFAFASEYLNDPMLDDAAPIKQHHIRLWKELPQQYNAVIAVDPAYSDDDRADYKVAVLVGVDHYDNRYLISYIRTHQPSGEFINSILNLYLQHKNFITGIGMPCGGTEKEFWNSVVRIAESRRLYPPFVELKNTFTQQGTDRTIHRKAGRVVAALQPLFEAGKYYINESHGEARDELLSIGASRWDDLVDAMAYAEQIIVPPMFQNQPKERGRYGEHLEEEKITYRDSYGY